MANNKKQKLIIQDLLSSPEIYTRTANIIEPSYFDQEYEPVIKYIHDYFGKYDATPAVDLIDAEFDISLEETKKVTKDRVNSTCDEIEKFCKETAVKEAIYNSLEDIETGEMGKVLSRLTDAVNISLQRDMGIEIYDNPEERLKTLIETFTPIPTGIEGIDGPLDGGLIRNQFTLFSANSGGGKSVMLANIGSNYSLQGYNVLYITLELPEEMVFLRLASIISGMDSSNWKAHIPEISSGIMAANQGGASGSYLIKQMSQHSCAADIRSYLTYYEMEYGQAPDVLLIDYLDLMDPNQGTSNIGIFEQDKRKSEEVVDIIKEYEMIGISASQQNRDALNMSKPNHSIIAGGISKINTVDNYISLFMDDNMRLQGEMNAYFLKTRSSRGVGHCSVLNFNPTNLRIGDIDGAGGGVMPRKRKDRKDIHEALEDIEGDINSPKKPAFNDDGEFKEFVKENNKEDTQEYTNIEGTLEPVTFNDVTEAPIMPRMPKTKVTRQDMEELVDFTKDTVGEY